MTTNYTNNRSELFAETSRQTDGSRTRTWRTDSHLLIVGNFPDQDFSDFAGVSVRVVVDLALSEEGDVSTDSDDTQKETNRYNHFSPWQLLNFFLVFCSQNILNSTSCLHRRRFYSLSGKLLWGTECITVEGFQKMLPHMMITQLPL